MDSAVLKYGLVPGVWNKILNFLFPYEAVVSRPGKLLLASRDGHCSKALVKSAATFELA